MSSFDDKSEYNVISTIIDKQRNVTLFDIKDNHPSGSRTFQIQCRSCDAKALETIDWFRAEVVREKDGYRLTTITLNEDSMNAIAVAYLKLFNMRELEDLSL